MGFRIVTWNMRAATARRLAAWNVFDAIGADVAALQEVMSLPGNVRERYAIVEGHPQGKRGLPQRSKNTIAVRGTICEPIHLQSANPWVNDALAWWGPCILARRVTLDGGQSLNVVSVYSPAWPLPREMWTDHDVTGIKLDNNPDVWCSCALWAGLRDTIPKHPGPWIVAGDFNLSIAFDLWRKAGRGNRESLERLRSIGLSDCLSRSISEPVMTWRHSTGRATHQLDYLLASADMRARLAKCEVVQSERVIDVGISDHLPIVADFATD